MRARSKQCQLPMSQASVGRQCRPAWRTAVRLVSFTLALAARSTSATAPLLEILYLKYNQQPIDTTPVFDPMVSQYKVRLDWKMEYFAVEATPVRPAIIDNIHLCRDDANCLKQDQRVVSMDFSKNIKVEPGGMVLYMFDVLLHGVVKSYTIKAHRLEGSETIIRHLVVQGSTLHPEFHPNTYAYRTLINVEMEVAQMELHLVDSGQTAYAEAGYALPLSERANITLIKNTHPGNTRSPPMRLRRRLREEAYGEFQYPNRYVDFPIPQMTSRTVNFKVISADGGHSGYYTLEIARGKCPLDKPLFDVQLSRCVKFCNVGFFPDYEMFRCKKCEDKCLNCLSLSKCMQCIRGDRRHIYELNNVTGQCELKETPLWEQHPQQALAAGIGIACVAVFVCGLCAFCQLSIWIKPSKKGHEWDVGDARKPRGQVSKSGHAPRASQGKPGWGGPRQDMPFLATGNPVYPGYGYAHVAQDDL